jgi:hypothetical protein
MLICLHPYTELGEKVRVSAQLQALGRQAQKARRRRGPQGKIPFDLHAQYFQPSSLLR